MVMNREEVIRRIRRRQNPERLTSNVERSTFNAERPPGVSFIAMKTRGDIEREFVFNRRP